VADLIPDFVNRAHNDGLETLLEGGAGSLLLLLGFIAWLGAHPDGRLVIDAGLDSGTQRQQAHRFYFREGMLATAFHFVKKLA
jgi:hypothetical protein